MKEYRLGNGFAGYYGSAGLYRGLAELSTDLADSAGQCGCTFGLPVWAHSATQEHNTQEVKML